MVGAYWNILEHTNKSYVSILLENISQYTKIPMHTYFRYVYVPAIERKHMTALH